MLEMDELQILVNPWPHWLYCRLSSLRGVSTTYYTSPHKLLEADEAGRLRRAAVVFYDRTQDEPVAVATRHDLLRAVREVAAGDAALVGSTNRRRLLSTLTVEAEEEMGEDGCIVVSAVTPSGRGGNNDAEGERGRAAPEAEWDLAQPQRYCGDCADQGVATAAELQSSWCDFQCVACWTAKPRFYGPLPSAVVAEDGRGQGWLRGSGSGETAVSTIEPNGSGAVMRRSNGEAGVSTDVLSKAGGELDVDMGEAASTAASTATNTLSSGAGASRKGKKKSKKQQRMRGGRAHDERRADN